MEERNTATNKQLATTNKRIDKLENKVKPEFKEQRNFIIDFFKVQNKEIAME